MGFGLLFIGYVFANVMSVTFVPKIIGYAIMLWGIIRLSDYEVEFKKCNLPLILAGTASIYPYLSDLFTKYLKIDVGIFPTSVVRGVSILEILLSVWFLTFLMLAVSSLAIQVDLKKISFRALRNIVVLLIGELLYVAAFCIPAGQVANVMAYIALFVRILRVILDVSLLFSCYRLICQEGDEDMPQKEIRIPIIKQMEEIMNKRDKNAFDSGKDFSEKYNKKRKNKKK